MRRRNVNSFQSRYADQIDAATAIVMTVIQTTAVARTPCSATALLPPEASKLIEKAEQNSRSASHPIRSNEAEAILRVAAESSA